MDSITVTITNKRAIDGLIASANASQLSLDDFLQQTLVENGNLAADIYKLGVFPTSDFILRFTSAEYSAIKAAAITDLQVEGLLAELSRSPIVNVNNPRLAPGLQYLVSTSLLTPERATEVASYRRPLVGEAPSQVDGDRRNPLIPNPFNR